MIKMILWKILYKKNRFLPSSSLEISWFLLGAILGDDRLLEDLDPELPFLDSLFSLGVWIGSLNWSSSRTFFLIQGRFKREFRTPLI